MAIVGTPAETTPDGSNDTASETITITFAAAKEEYPLFEPLIVSFQADNPGIRIQLVDINQAATTTTLANGDVMTSLGPESLRAVLSLADTATGIGPTREAIANGWLRDLSPLIDADPTFDRADFYPHTLVLEPNGQIYSLPAKQYVDLLAYNKALWASRDLPPPQPDWTWSDLKAAAQQLARKRGTTVEVYGMVDWGPGLPALLAELVEAGFQRDSAAPVRLDDPTIVAALERVVALAQSGAYRGGNDFRQQILNQQVGIWPATPNMLAAEVCWTWLKALSGEISHLRGAVPARISLAESDAFHSQAAPGAAAVYQAYRAALQRSLTDAAQTDAQSVIDYYWFFQAIDRALHGNDLEQELAGAQMLTTQFLECVRGGTDGNACATQVDPAYQGWRYAAPGGT